MPVQNVNLSYFFLNSRKPRVLSFSTRNEVDLEPLACEDGALLYTPGSRMKAELPEPCAGSGGGGGGGGVQTPPPPAPEKSQKYRVS